jgi:hypothetical protein
MFGRNLSIFNGSIRLSGCLTKTVYLSVSTSSLKKLSKSNVLHKSSKPTQAKLKPEIDSINPKVNPTETKVHKNTSNKPNMQIPTP